jgi:ankyrin repeat protein
MDILTAASNGDLQKVKEILRTNPKLACEPGEGPIHWAAKCNHVDIMVELMKHGADPNAPDCEGRTPLHYAAEDSLQAARFLIQQHVDLNPEDELGYTPLVLAIRERTPHGDEIAEALLAAGAEYNLLAAAAWGDIARLRETLAKDHDAIHKLSQTKQDILLGEALIGMGLIDENYVEMLEVLFEYGLRPSKCIVVPEVHAFEGEVKEFLLHYLLQDNLDLNTEDKNGYTPLLCAIRKGTRKGEEIARGLLAAGAEYDLHAAVAWGDFARVIQISSKDPDAIRKLSQKKQDIVFDDAVSGVGHRLGDAQKVEMAELLLKQGLRPSKEIVAAEARELTGEIKRYLCQLIERADLG